MLLYPQFPYQINNEKIQKILSNGIEYNGHTKRALEIFKYLKNDIENRKDLMVGQYREKKYFGENENKYGCWYEFLYQDHTQKISLPGLIYAIACAYGDYNKYDFFNMNFYKKNLDDPKMSYATFVEWVCLVSIVCETIIGAYTLHLKEVMGNVVELPNGINGNTMWQNNYNIFQLNDRKWIDGPLLKCLLDEIIPDNFTEFPPGLVINGIHMTTILPDCNFMRNFPAQWS